VFLSHTRRLISLYNSFFFRTLRGVLTKQRKEVSKKTLSLNAKHAHARALTTYLSVSSLCLWLWLSSPRQQKSACPLCSRRCVVKFLSRFHTRGEHLWEEGKTIKFRVFIHFQKTRRETKSRKVSTHHPSRTITRRRRRRRRRRHTRRAKRTLYLEGKRSNRAKRFN